MAESTGPILAIGGLTIANRVIFNDKPMDWRVPIGTAIAAVLFSGAERAVGRTAVYVSYLALVTVVFARVDPKVPSPAESALRWFEER
jgi:predicted membrane-bound dolichyl-phosphate-mannose-protein mannosyltransferase